MFQDTFSLGALRMGQVCPGQPSHQRNRKMSFGTFKNKCNCKCNPARNHNKRQRRRLDVTDSTPSYLECEGTVEPQREKTYRRICVPSEDSDQAVQSALGDFRIAKDAKFL